MHTMCHCYSLLWPTSAAHSHSSKPHRIEVRGLAHHFWPYPSPLFDAKASSRFEAWVCLPDLRLEASFDMGLWTWSPGVMLGIRGLGLNQGLVPWPHSGRQTSNLKPGIQPQVMSLASTQN